MYPARVVIDVNIPAIYLVEDHPGHPYVRSYLDKLFERRAAIYAHSVTPYRVLWILTRLWGFGKQEALEAVRSFLEARNVIYVGLTREWLLRSFEFSKQLRHDVYDCSYLALALMVGAEAIVTTDTDFKKLAPKLGLKYVNPVPEDIIKKFSEHPNDNEPVERRCAEGLTPRGGASARSSWPVTRASRDPAGLLRGIVVASQGFKGVS